MHPCSLEAKVSLVKRPSAAPHLSYRQYNSNGNDRGNGHCPRYGRAGNSDGDDIHHVDVGSLPHSHGNGTFERDVSTDDDRHRNTSGDYPRRHNDLYRSRLL